MRIEAISIGENPPHEVNMIVEVPIGGEPIKYEMDKAAGTMVVDRFLYTAMRYPGNYGFIPHTLSEDGDPVDILLVTQRTLVPGAVVACRPIGVLEMTDESGGDEKIVAVPVSRITRRYDKIKDVADLPEIQFRRLSTFSRTTRTWNRASGPTPRAGAATPKPNAASSKPSSAPSRPDPLLPARFHPAGRRL